MPKRTMGGRADAGADAMAHEASKCRAKLHMEKPLPAGEVSSRQQGGLDVVDHVQAPVQVSPTPEQVAPSPEQVTHLPRHLPPLPRHLPPLPQPVVNVNDDDEEEEVAALVPQKEQVSPLPRVTPPVPEPVVVGDVNKEDVLSDDVDSDPETQRIFRRQKSRQLNSGELEKDVRPRFGKGYGCPFCNKVMKGDLSSTINHAIGTSQGSTKNGYAFRVKHAAYADYLMRLL
ncbi:hypothetical protein VPH35_091146 [Triticum aestivum]